MIVEKVMSQLWTRCVRAGSNLVDRSVILIGGNSGGSHLWRRVTLIVGAPVVILCMINAYTGRDVELERQPFVKYDYLRRRNKRFPWGDGERSFFHNPNANALSEGYEA